MSETIRGLIIKIDTLRRQCASVSAHLNSQTSCEEVSALLYKINGQLYRAYLSAIKLYKKLFELEAAECVKKW